MTAERKVIHPPIEIVTDGNKCGIGCPVNGKCRAFPHEVIWYAHTDGGDRYILRCKACLDAEQAESFASGNVGIHQAESKDGDRRTLSHPVNEYIRADTVLPLLDEMYEQLKACEWEVSQGTLAKYEQFKENRT